jgi:hypothetical protein
MRSYVKAYQKGSVFYNSLGEVPGDPDMIWAILRPHKAEYLFMLNYLYNNYIGGWTYFGNDPTMGVSLNTFWPGPFIQFEDYRNHPPD